MIHVTEVRVPAEAEVLVFECRRNGALAQARGSLSPRWSSPRCAALAARATVRFADIDLDRFNMDAGAAAAAMTDGTRCLVPAHLYGRPAPMGALAALVLNHGLLLVEDSAQAHAADIDGRRTGSWGLGCFSFDATKSMTTGEGGMVNTSDPVLADRMRVLRNRGMRSRYQYDVVGHNRRMTRRRLDRTRRPRGGAGAVVARPPVPGRVGRRSGCRGDHRTAQLT